MRCGSGAPSEGAVDAAAGVEASSVPESVITEAVTKSRRVVRPMVVPVMKLPDYPEDSRVAGLPECTTVEHGARCTPRFAHGSASWRP